jgi:hypothetical protein
METFPARLAAAVERYRDLQAEDGGWGEDRFTGAETSIVNTVEVLHVLKSAHTLYRDSAVQRGLAYIERAVFAHPRKQHRDDPDARGEHTRYCAWGLSGLTLYPESRQDERWQKAQRHCVTWLADHRLSGTGPRAWGETPEDVHPALLSTAASVLALDRLTGYHPSAPQAASLAASARAVVTDMAQRVRTQAWWPRVASDWRPSPSATALAVLTLLHGDVGNRGVATMGAAWLRANRRTWQGTVETESSARGANWDHMTFSLGLRAVVLAEGGVDPFDLLVRSAVHYMHELWSDEKAEWSHGRPGARVSPSGSYAVVMAHEALRRVWPFDAVLAIDGKSPAVQRWGRNEKAEVHVHVKHDGTFAINDLNGREVAEGVKLTKRLEPIFVALARRHHEGAAEDDLEARSRGLDELAEELNLAPDVLRRYLGRINDRIREYSEGRMGDIVQMQRRRCFINVDRVTLHERWLDAA